MICAKFNLLAAALGLCILSPSPALALSEGVDYAVLFGAPLPPAANEEITVREFFNYSCPACSRLQPPLRQWIEDMPEDQKEQVKMLQTPVPFTRWGGLFAKAHFVLEAFGREDLQKDLYYAIHSERKLLNSEKRLAEWMGSNGIDEQKARKAFDSFSVSTKIKRAERLAKLSGVDSTPQLIVAERYRLTPALSKTYERMLATLDKLIERIREGNPPD